MSKPKQPVIRNRVYGTEYRIIRTAANSDGDLVWRIRRIDADKSLGWLSVDAWATGNWEVVTNV